MLTPVVQRWREHRSLYRPAGEPINTRAYEVAEMPGDGEARAFVEAHHYSRTYPAARFRFGLYRRGALVGVAVFSHPVNDKALAMFPGKPVESVELGRLVLLDDVPANGESWFVAQCFECLRRRGLFGVLSMSDPVPRDKADGERVFAGHIGTTYQALNALYLGRATARTLLILPDGMVFSDRAAQKIRKQERGWQYAVEQLIHAGAPCPDRDALASPAWPRLWLKMVLPLVTRKLRHPGNFRYVWALKHRNRKHLRLPSGLSLESLPPYPKPTGLPPAVRWRTTNRNITRER